MVKMYGEEGLESEWREGRKYGTEDRRVWSTGKLKEGIVGGRKEGKEKRR